MSAPPGEWRANWPLVVSCILGVPIPTVAVYSLGQFMPDLERTFAWSRTEVSAGLSLSLVLGFFLSPLIGRIADVMNVRLLVLPGLALSGGAIAAFSLADGRLGIWLALWAAHAAACALIAPTVWISVIASAFQANRSLAMALALSGSGLGTALAPISSRYLIDTFGWRAAYPLLGLAWAGIALVGAALFFFDRRPNRAKRGTDGIAIVREPLLPLLRSATFLKLVVVVFAAMVIISANIIHLAPALVDHGFNAVDAARVAGVAGLAAIAGKLGVGLFYDRVPMALVNNSVMVLLGLSSLLLLLLAGRQPGVAFVACIALGACAGGMLTIMACVTARLFSPQHFGVVFGALTSVMSLAAAVGPTATSAVHDRFGSYDAMFAAGLVVAALSAILLRSLKPVSAASTEPTGLPARVSGD